MALIRWRLTFKGGLYSRKRSIVEEQPTTASKESTQYTLIKLAYSIDSLVLAYIPYILQVLVAS